MVCFYPAWKEYRCTVWSWKVGNMVLFVTLLCEPFRHASGFFYPWLYCIVYCTVWTLYRSQRFHGFACKHLPASEMGNPASFFIFRSVSTKVLTPILDKFAVLIFNIPRILHSSCTVYLNSIQTALKMVTKLVNRKIEAKLIKSEQN